MTDAAIRATDLSKRFTLHAGSRRGLKERLTRRNEVDRAQHLWALRDLTFEVPQGETLGIIGHNGAGKSTALKVLAGIFRPTYGTCEITGRVNALLELGSGFHPALTGRENVRLNGSILGFSRRQIEALMDQIIEFSGIEDFIDSPVKIYSSGMYARLGFSVAVNLDPDVLILDEVLAVGDTAFKKKCDDHLAQLKQRGTTVLIVSHSLSTIQKMCDTVVWLDHGRMVGCGHPPDVIADYMRDVEGQQRIAAGSS